MANKDASTTLAPMVVQVIDEFATAMRADGGIEDNAVDRMEELLRKGTVPKPEEIDAALFEPPPDDEA